jgi:hypothetical protein
MKLFAIKALGILALALTLNVAGVLLLALPLEWVWKTSLVPVFALPPINYLQSVGLLGLAAIVRLVVVGGGIDFKFTQHDT